jgi:hypothetical protein
VRADSSSARGGARRAADDDELYSRAKRRAQGRGQGGEGGGGGCDLAVRDVKRCALAKFCLTLAPDLTEDCFMDWLPHVPVVRVGIAAWGLCDGALARRKIGAHGGDDGGVSLLVRAPNCTR